MYNNDNKNNAAFKPIITWQLKIQIIFLSKY